VKKIIAGIVMSLVLTGCGAGPGEIEPVETNTTGPAPEQVEPAFEIGSTDVYYIRYDDGTRCVVTDRHNGGTGVACDWTVD
jgi:hypothetical protein